MGMQEMMDGFQLQWESTRRELATELKALERQMKQELYEAQRENSVLVMEIERREKENEQLKEELLRMDSKIELLEIEQETINFARRVLDKEAHEENGKNTLNSE